jgi:hypothetical protein
MIPGRRNAGDDLCGINLMWSEKQPHPDVGSRHVVAMQPQSVLLKQA